jgi:ferredoxin
MAKPDAPVRSAEEEDSPESATETLAANRLADGCGASGSCTCCALPVEARPKQTRARIKRKHTVLEALGMTATQKLRFRGLY